MSSARHSGRPTHLRCAVAVILLAAGWLAVSGLQAADPNLVGVLALAVEDEVAQKLGLTESQKKALNELVEARQTEAGELAAQLGDLSAPERAAKLAAFRAESEIKGWTLLNPDQQGKLKGIWMQRAGLASLADPDVADRLNLTPQQRQAVAEVLKRRAELLGNEVPVEAVQTLTERGLAGVLTQQQQAVWKSLSAGSGPGIEKPAVDDSAEVSTEPVAETPRPAEASAGDSAAAADPPPERGQPAVVPGGTAPGEPKADPSRRPMTGPDGALRLPWDPSSSQPGLLRFSFRYQPWSEVLDWFAEQAGLSLVLDSPPPGTFNYTDDRVYTPAEAIDLLNKVLSTKGYMLVRSERMLMLFNLEEGVPGAIVSTVPLEELDSRGEFELVSVLFQLEKLSAEEAQQEIQQLLGPQGSVVVLPKSQKIFVTDTGGRLQTVRSVIQAIEDPQGPASNQLRSFPLTHATADEVLAVVRQLFDIPIDQFATTDGSLRFALDPLGTTLLVTGKPDLMARFSEVVRAVDVTMPVAVEGGLSIEEAQQLVVYPITTADPDSVLQVLQTLMTGSIDIRLALDPKTNCLIAMARPYEHATIRATLDEMQVDAKIVEVIQLHVLDPQLAVLSITQMLGSGTAEDPSGPTVDADPNTRQLLVRGTAGQIAQIRELLKKLGETEGPTGSASRGGNVRMLPLSSAAARAALGQMRNVWPAMRHNKIREITPSAEIPSMRIHESEPARPTIPADFLYELFNANPGIEPPPARPPAERPVPEDPAPEPAAGDKTTAAPRPGPLFGGSVSLVSQPGEEAGPEESETEPAQIPSEPVPQNEPPEIVVSVGPGGLMIACQDVQVLNDFEDMLNALAGSALSGEPGLTIFYLKYAKAATVAPTLSSIISGSTLSMSSPLLDSEDGGLGTLLGLGSSTGSIASSGPVQIIPETRLNALIVQANPADLDMIKQLLEILDQRESPEDVMVEPKPRTIPVYNAPAEEIAEIVKELYQDRLVRSSGSSGGSSGRQPSPQEFFEAMRRGGGSGSSRGGGSSRSTATENVQRMSIAVDARNNALIVSAPEPLFEEVRTLIESLDQAALDSHHTLATVTLKGVSPEMIQQALSALVGDAVQFGNSGSSGSRSSSSRGSSTGSRPSSSSSGGGSSSEDMRRRMEFMRAMQERMRGGGGSPFGGGRPGGGGGPPGGGGRPGGGGGPR